MIERLQRISAELFKNALKTYSRKDVLTHKRSHSNNLSEMLLLYPNAGVNFFISKKSWPDGLHYQVTRSTHKSNRNGVFYGIKTVVNAKGKQGTTTSRPVRLNGLSKRGIWTYSLGKFDNCKTDNEIVYNRADFEAFAKVSGIGISKEKPQDRQEDNSEAQSAQE